MATVKDIYTLIDEKAPFSMQMSFDNAGFLIGRSMAQVSRVMIALDITKSVIEEAVEHKVDLIVTHHPIIFNKLSAITDDSPNGELIISLIEHNLAVISAHTNLDKVNGGVNTVLAERIALINTIPLELDGVDDNGEPFGVGRVGERSNGETTLHAFISELKQALDLEGLRVSDAGKPVKRVAVGGGSCGSMLALVKNAQCDTFITGDVKHDVYLEAKHLGINLIDAGHFKTEVLVCNTLKSWITSAFPCVDVMISREEKEAFIYR